MTHPAGTVSPLPKIDDTKVKIDDLTVTIDGKSKGQRVTRGRGPKSHGT